MSEKPKILIVDDERAIARAIEIRLRAQGYDVLLAHDGAEGLEMARRQQPDAIVLDVRMPVMNGMEVLARLATKKETRHIPVVMASASMVDRSTALDMGPGFFWRSRTTPRRSPAPLNDWFDILDKPIVFEELLEELRNHIAVPARPSLKSTVDVATVDDEGIFA